VFDSNVAGTFDIYVISAEGGTVRRLTTGPGDNAVPSWSRDGKWIYFTSLRTGTNQIWKVPATGGEAKQVTRNGGAVPFESPDGSWLYYKKRRDDTGPLWRMRVNEEPETVFLPQAVFWRNFVIMPTGIYFMREEGTRTLIEVYRFATNTTESLATLSKAPYVGLTVTPDEKRILYTQVDNAGRNVMLVENFR
jgi:Tol biopolymer transport system component